MARKCDLTDVGVMSGNSVSHSCIKTKRKFLPNLQNASFKSDVLGVKLNFKLASKTIRTINKYGSLDAFLINANNNKLSEKGQKLRKRIKKILIERNEYLDIKILKDNKKVA